MLNDIVDCDVGENNEVNISISLGEKHGNLS
jgi:hypothetical protein